MMNVALDLARRGFRVFPLAPYGKLPAIQNFQYEATTDANQIVLWWTKSPQANVGVLTTGRVVIDVDTKNNRGGLASYGLVGGHWHTLVVQTPSGGYHAYFDGPDSRLAVNLLPGLDIRSHNGYVVAPGSYLSPSLSGEDVVEGRYVVVSDEPIPRVPIAIEMLLRPPRDRATRRDDGVEVDTAANIGVAREWLAVADPATSGQGGNNQTFRVAARLVRDFALSEETAFQLMSEDYNPRCQPPWSADDLYELVHNASEYGTGNLGSASPDLMFAGTSYVDPMTVTPPPDGGKWKGNAMLLSELRPRPWIVRDLMLRRSVTLIAGAGAGGKSMTALAMCAHFGLGKDFGPYRLADPGKALVSVIYNAEDDMDEQSRRLAAICHQFDFDYDAVRENLVLICRDHVKLKLVHFERGAGLVIDGAKQYIKNITKEAKADIVVLDPLVSLHNANENDNNQMSVVMGVVEELAMDTNAAVFLQHHMPKGGYGNADRAGNPDTIRGAASITTTPRIALTITSASKDDVSRYRLTGERSQYVRIDDAKTNYFGKSNEASVWMRWNTIRLGTGDFVGVPVPIDMNARGTEAMNAIAELVEQMIRRNNGGYVTLTDAATALKASDPLRAETNIQTIKSQIQKALGNGVRLPAGGMMTVNTEKISGHQHTVIKLI